MVDDFAVFPVHKVLLVQCATALLLGYVIGYVGVYGILDDANQDCPSYVTEEACESVQYTECSWTQANNTCTFKDVDCRQFTEAECRSNEVTCLFDIDNNMCDHRTGLSPTLMGVFAGAMALGGILGAAIAGCLVNRKGRRFVLRIGGMLCLIGCVISHGARAGNIFGLLIASRFLMGVGTSVGCVVSPMYTEEMARQPFTKQVGISFQVFLTIGITLAATVGAILMPRDKSVPQHMELRFQMLNAMQTLLACFAVGVYVRMEESTWYEWYVKKAAASKKTDEEEQRSLVPAGPSGLLYRGEDAATARITWLQMVFPLVVAVFVCMAQQLTGINAIMNYAYTITKSMGLTPIMGNFIVMLWNCVTTLPSIIIASRLTLRQMFLMGTSVATFSVFLTGISIYPGTLSSTIKDGLSGLGIFLFIAGFELGMGSTMYVFAQVLFPTAFRNSGAAFVIATQYAFNLFINFLFPITVSALSDGRDDQSFGIASVFIFFGFCGGISLIILFRFLYPFKEEVLVSPSSTILPIS